MNDCIQCSQDFSEFEKVKLSEGFWGWRHPLLDWPWTVLMALPFNSISCNQMPNEEECGGCGWKCHCYVCSEDANSTWNDCQCSCRFWVLACFSVLLVFFVVFYVAAVFRRVLLYTMSTGAVILAGGLSILSAVSDHCGWPAYASITLVFAFPCAYSCMWQCTQQYEQLGSRVDASVRENAPEGKQSSAVVMVFPGGEIQLGMSVEEGSINASTERKKNVWVSAGIQDTHPNSGGGRDLEAEHNPGNWEGRETMN